jgi:hypothetical protein
MYFLVVGSLTPFHGALLAHVELDSTVVVANNKKGNNIMSEIRHSKMSTLQFLRKPLHSSILSYPTPKR